MTDLPPRNPYPGLRPFEQEDADYFFGRETHTEELLQRLTNARFLAVVGTSGSGKSSLVRAGLIPALHGDRLAVGSHWRVAIFRPGDDPIHAMADALHGCLPAFAPAENDFRRDMLETTLRRSSLGLVETVKQSHLQDRENILLVVDQFEELFRFQDRAGTELAKDESAAFVKFLLEGAANPSVSIFILITMRSDFLGDCARFRDFPEAVNRGLYLVPRLTREQLRQAIEGPAAVARGKISPALVERLLNEIGDDQDQLPVLQHALMRTWRPSGRIGIPEYEATGGMEKALSQHADEALGKFSTDEQKELVRKLFQCITEKGADQREVRRPTRFREICAICGVADESQLRTAIEWFRGPGRSFLMPPAPTPITDDSFIDISHESLIRKWIALRGWVDEEAESANMYRRLAGGAERHGKGQEGLLQDPGLRLVLDRKASATWNEDWGKRYASNYSEAIAYLDKSRLAREAQAREKENRQKKELSRTRAFAAILALAFFGALALAAYAYRQKTTAEEQTLLAMGERRKADAQKIIAEEQKAIAEAKSKEAQANLASAEEQSKKAEAQKIIAEEQKAIAEANSKEAQANFASAVEQRKKAEDRKKEADRQRNIAELRAQEANQQKQIATNLSKFSRRLLYVANMNLAAKAFDERDYSRGHDLLNLSLPTSAGTPQDDPRSFYWFYLWRSNHQELTTLKGHGSLVLSVAFSSDGKTLASAGADRTVKLWDVATRQELATLKGHGSFVRSVAFSRDGKTLASASDDRTVKLWDVATRQELATLKGHGSFVRSVAFSSDGRTLASASDDGTVKLWDVATRQELATLKGHGSLVLSVAFSSDGKTLASASDDGTVKLWDVATRQELATLKGHGEGVRSVAFSSDGKTLASASDDRTVKLWNVATRQELATLKGHGDFVRSVAFSSDGKTLASAGADRTVKLWDVATRQELTTLKGHGDFVRSVAFSSDGKTLASASDDRTVKLWDVATRQELATLKGHGEGVRSVAFSRDGRTLASASDDRTVKLWDVATRQELATLKGHGNLVLSVVFSSDGKMLASASGDRTVKLWEAASEKQVAAQR